MEADHKLSVFLDWDIYVALRLLLEYFAISLQSLSVWETPPFAILIFIVS